MSYTIKQVDCNNADVLGAKRQILGHVVRLNSAPGEYKYLALLPGMVGSAYTLDGNTIETCARKLWEKHYSKQRKNK